jgi:hypothetical protein
MKPPANTCRHNPSVFDRGAGPTVVDYASKKWPLPLRALASSSPKNQFSSCRSRLLGKGDASASHDNASVPQCIKCGKLHFGICLYGSGLCFWCGKPGNFVRRCPILAAVSQSSPIVAKCSRCGKTHPGECHWEMPRTCFKCDLVDHYARNCEQVTIRLQGSQAGNF